METRKVLMKSNVAASNLLRSLHSLYQFGYFCDVRIHTDQPGMQEEFFVHKAVLAASSNYFKCLFLSDEMLNAKDCEVTLQDVHAEEFASFLRFVYTTEVEIEADGLQRIKEVAERFECQDLLAVLEEMKNADGDSDLSVPLRRRKTGWSQTKQIEETELPHILSAPMKRNLWDRKKHAKLSASCDNNESKAECSPEEEIALVKSEDEMATSTGLSKADLLQDPITTDTSEEENKINHPSANQVVLKEAIVVLNRIMPGQKGVPEETKFGKTTHNVSKALPQMYACDLCNRSFNFAKQYQSHMEVEHDIHVVIKYSCNMCDQLFASSQNLRQHRLTVHNSEQCFPCLLCDKRFKRQKDVNDHIRRVHEKKRNPQRCPYCDKIISSRTGLTVHIRTHTGEKPYKCQYCPARFAQRSAFNTHVRSHTGEKPYICEDCGACFIDKGKLNSHKRTHTGERLFRCDVCGKHFSTNEYLKCHKRCHMGAKPYKCDVCGKTFGLRASLAQHSNVHAETPPYFCEQCGKTFTQQGALRRHQRIHTGEKPYKCRACERTFTDMSTLRRHVLVHDRNAHWRSFLIDLTVKKDHNWSKIETLSNSKDDSTPVWSD